MEFLAPLMDDFELLSFPRAMSQADVPAPKLDAPLLAAGLLTHDGMVDCMVVSLLLG